MKRLALVAVLAAFLATGVTAAYLLKKAGATVVLLERDRCGGVDTAYTTAHLTFVMKLGTKESGDTLGTFLLHRSPEGMWKVIGEITDSRPVPPSYLLELP